MQVLTFKPAFNLSLVWPSMKNLHGIAFNHETRSKSIQVDANQCKSLYVDGQMKCKFNSRWSRLKLALTCNSVWLRFYKGFLNQIIYTCEFHVAYSISFNFFIFYLNLKELGRPPIFQLSVYLFICLHVLRITSSAKFMYWDTFFIYYCTTLQILLLQRYYNIQCLAQLLLSPWGQLLQKTDPLGKSITSLAKSKLYYNNILSN